MLIVVRIFQFCVLTPLHGGLRFRLEWFFAASLMERFGRHSTYGCNCVNPAAPLGRNDSLTIFLNKPI